MRPCASRRPTATVRRSRRPSLNRLLRHGPGFAPRIASSWLMVTRRARGPSSCTVQKDAYAGCEREGSTRGRTAEVACLVQILNAHPRNLWLDRTRRIGPPPARRSAVAADARTKPRPRPYTIRPILGHDSGASSEKHAPRRRNRGLVMPRAPTSSDGSKGTGPTRSPARPRSRPRRSPRRPWQGMPSPSLSLRLKMGRYPGRGCL